MRPQSIVMFERLFLASLALSAIGFVVGYDAAREEVTRQPGMAQLGDAGGSILIGSMVVTTAVYLLLWFLIARKASNVAKWFLTAFTAIGAVLFAASFVMAGITMDLNAALMIVYYVLAVAAVVFLFKPDAEAWLKGQPAADPAAFD